MNYIFNITLHYIILYHIILYYFKFYKIFTVNY